MNESNSSAPHGRVPRARFSSRLALLLTMVGVAVGLGNVWRFPYMVGKFGGASFVLFYVLTVVLLGIPALMAEWSLGRHTQRGPVGAFNRVGLPLGRPLGWIFFIGVTAATAYYTNAVGWVLFYLVGQILQRFGLPWQPVILPPEDGFDPLSIGLQVAMTLLVTLACAGILIKGLRRGIEIASKVLMPLLYVSLLVLIVRGVTLPGAWAGIEWYLLKFDFDALKDPGAILAAVGQAMFSLSLGGTFMVVYGSYLGGDEELQGGAVWTAVGDVGAGLLAGLAILPAVFAFNLEPASGPGLLFFTLPEVFKAMPLGWLFGLLFFGSLLGAAFLSDVGAFEVLVAGLTDNTRLNRQQAVWTMAGVVFLFSLPPMINQKIFGVWDLTFGSGFQTFGALVAVVAFGWCLDRSVALAQLSSGSVSSGSVSSGSATPTRLLYAWLRYVVPTVLLTLGIWWLLKDVFGLVQ